MSLNGLMHSRNIYRNKPNFAQMAKTYPSFGVYVRTDLRGKTSIDFNDCNALRELTKTLLKKDFDLNVNIHEDRLIPTVPQRLNYVLFVEDLVLKLCQFLRIDAKNRIIGLDVGTGCCAIFPLIGSTINKNWHFVATDVDPINIESALNNVSNNGLTDRIKIIEVKNDFNFRTIVDSIDESVHFLMTNPPFFSDSFNDSDVSKDETDIQIDSESIESKLKSKDKQISGYRKKSSANTSNPIESVVDGGEVEFVSKIIEMSLELKEKIMIYSSMFGKKSSLKQIKCIVKSYAEKEIIKSFVCTEFCQGLTKRWGIAWTFITGLNLKEVPITKAIKSKSSLIYYLPPIMKGIDYKMESISERIKSILINDLKIIPLEVIESKKRIAFRIRTNTNSWSNQRRRRREEKRKIEMNSMNTNIEAIDGHNYDNSPEIAFKPMESQVKNGKRGLDDMECDDNEMEDNSKRNKAVKEYSGNELYLLDANLVIKREKQSIYIEMQTQDQSRNKETTHQLFQFFKNILI